MDRLNIWDYSFIIILTITILYFIRLIITEYRNGWMRWRKPYEIEERLTVMRNPLIFRYFLHYYLKNYYRIGKEKWYYEVYYIYCKKVKEEHGHRIYKWDLYTESYYNWDQANILLNKIREEKSQIIRERRKQALKNKPCRYFKEDNKILYK